METLDQYSQSPVEGMYVNESVKKHLNTIGKWNKFLAIIGFIGIGFMVIFGITATFVGASMRIPNMPQTGFFGLIYLVFALFYYFPTKYLYNSSKYLIQATSENSQISLEQGVENLKSFFKFIGIFTIVIISIYVLIFLFAIVGIGLLKSF